MASTRRRPEVERLDRAGALDGLGEGRVHDRVRRVLAQVAVLGAGEVPAQPHDQRRDAEQAGDRDPPADADRGDERDDRRDDRDRPLGQRPADRPAELVDVAAGAGQQVAGAGRLDDADRQRERVADEVLAQLRQHLLAEHLAGQPGVPGEHRLQDQEAGQRQDDLVDVRRRGAGLDGLDQVAQQPRRGQGGHGGEDVQGQRGPQQPRVAARDRRGVPPDGRGVRDRQRGRRAHAFRGPHGSVEPPRAAPPRSGFVGCFMSSPAPARG